MSDNRLTTQLVRRTAARSVHREHAEGMFLTSSFIFDSAEQAAEKFALPHADYIYSRFSNPNIKTLCERMAALEEAPTALATASGMAAILATVLSVCKNGSHLLCGGEVFGSTIQLLSNHLVKFGVQVDYIFGDVGEWKTAMQKNTALLILETPSNPMLTISDIAQIAEIAHGGGALLAVDNCFCPFGQKPLTLGADLVIHSATKYLDGQGRVLGGMIVGAEELLYERIYPFLRCGGPALSPFNAWTISRGLETLPYRMRAHCQAASTLAHWLQTQPRIKKVLYAGLESHVGHELAMKQQSGLGGGIISILLEGGRAQAWRFINALTLFSITANFGDVKSTVTHPATTTHAKISAAHRAAAAIGDNLVRLSIGLEDIEDLQEDITRALAAV